jgi:DNA-binding winged helix-turn-helix (wHTH) protein/serine/threonine protein kinase
MSSPDTGAARPPRGRSAAPAPDAPRFSYRFGSAEFDQARFELRVAGLPVEAERRVLTVLDHLLRHAGEVVTKEDLLDTVWAGRVTVEKVLANAIAKLRRALGPGNAGQIVTQARVGYRLTGPVARQPVSAAHQVGLELVAGTPVPGRENFLLHTALAVRPGGEIWLAEHTKTRERRVYKFAADGERIRQLKREATLLRVLDASAGDARCFVELIDWRFESSPYFLEFAWAGDNLATWADVHLASLDRRQRLALFGQIAEAVAVAHAAGVLHKDIKPANILVAEIDGASHVRLSDFGIGALAEADQLDRLGITANGLTIDDVPSAERITGTLHYLAPEVLAGQASTTRADVYALGVLLYQLLAGDLRRPMASGWERDIDDPLLCQDIRQATEGRPQHRLSHAAELAVRLRELPSRHQARQRELAAEQDRVQAREALARSRARRPWVVASVVVLGLGLALALWLQQRTDAARSDALRQLQHANAMLRFLEEDLVSRANPLVAGQGTDVPFRDVLLTARDRLAARFQAQPVSEARLRLSFASLFNTLDLWPDALAEIDRALAVLDRPGLATDLDAVRAQAMRVQLLSRMGRLPEAQSALDALRQRPVADPDSPVRQFHLAAAEGIVRMASGAALDAAAAFETAIGAHDAAWPEGGAQRDSLMLDLIYMQSTAGRSEQAIARFDAFVADLEARPGDHESLKALARLRVARAVSLGGDHDRAEALLLAARPVLEQRFGADHSQVVGLLGELLGIQFRRGAWDRAVPLAREVHERVKATLGPDHAMAAVSLGNVGRTLYEAGQPGPAAPVLDQALAGVETALGPDSPQVHDLRFIRVAVALVLADAATARQGLSRLDAAQLERARPTGNWPAAIGLLQGLLAAQDGEPAQALALLDANLPVVEAADGGRDSPFTRQARRVRDGLSAPAAARAP